LAISMVDDAHDGGPLGEGGNWTAEKGIISA
jgi:hypothetical protein